MDAYQKEIFRKMLQLINDFSVNQAPMMGQTIYELESLMLEAKIKDKIIVDGWFDKWTPIESHLAISEHNQTTLDLGKVMNDLQTLKAFIEQFLNVPPR